jgi:hypothetical protein
MATRTAELKRNVKRAATRAIVVGETKADRAVARSRQKVDAELKGLESTLLGKISDVRRAIASAADDGAAIASRGLDQAIRSSRKGVRRLEKKWQRMDTRQKAGVVGGLLAALAAAAAAPTLIRKARGR